MSYDATCGAAFAYACRMWLGSGWGKGDTVPQSMRVGTLRALRTDSARAFEAVCRTARWPLVTAPDAREVVAGMTPTADLTREIRDPANGYEAAAPPCCRRPTALPSGTIKISV